MMFTSKNITTSDQQKIRYYLHEKPQHPWLVFCNGIGASTRAWEPMFAHFSGDFSILYWDYRGLDNQPIPIGIDRHGEDLWEILQHEGIDSFHLIGWSMGVQVALSLFQKRSPAVVKMVLLNGAAGKAVTELLQRKNWFVVQPICRLLVAAGKYIDRFGPTAAASEVFLRRFTRICIHFRWLGRDLDRKLFCYLLQEWFTVDLSLIAKQALELGNHSAEAYVGQIQTPSLVITGNLDPLVSNRLTEELAMLLPNGELRCFFGSSHFTLMEYPDKLHALIDKFFAIRPADDS